jgi:hypothetical protein
MLWNALCDQKIVPQTFINSLTAQDAHLVLTEHTLYELGRTFTSSKPDAHARGRELLTYAQQYAHHVLCAKKGIELVAAEMWALKLGAGGMIEAFHNEENCGLMRALLARLAAGEVDDRVRAYNAERLQYINHNRTGQIRHFENNPEKRAELQTISEENLPRWLMTETLSMTGVALLARHIVTYFPQTNMVEASEYALAILMSPTLRVGGTLVRADLYYNWRCAHLGSNRKDLTEDMEHVVSASCCDVYATQEQRQVEYARLLLNDGTRVEIYDGETPVDEWLLGLEA